MKCMLLSLLACVVLTVPHSGQAQTVPRVVLIEYFTGTWAEWGPRGDDSLVAVQSRWPNTRVISYHLSSSSATDPMETTNGNIVRDSLSAGFAPGAVFDRIVWQVGASTYSFILDWTLWEAALSVRAANSPTTMLSINVAGTFDTLSRQVGGVATLTALQAMPGSYYVHVVVTEDDLDFPQVKNTGTTVLTLPSYLHKKVVRLMVTGGIGSQLTSTGFSANQVIPYPISFTLPSVMNWRKCHITVFVDADLGIPYGHRYVQQAWQGLLSNFNVIPVELVSFSGESVQGGIRLSWRTASENNNMGWIIERRSIDTDRWSDVAFVQGNGTTKHANMYDFLDETVAENVTYDYRLRQTDFDGKTDRSSVVRVSYLAMPNTTTLRDNYPNPCNPTTTIVVQLAQEDAIRLEIFDRMGRIVATLVDGIVGAGNQAFTWNGTDAGGNALPPGTYFYRLHTSTQVQTKQMLLVR